MFVFLLFIKSKFFKIDLEIWIKCILVILMMKIWCLVYNSRLFYVYDVIIYV